MRVFLDTSVLVAAAVHAHAGYARAAAVWDRVQSGEDEGFISAHSLAEMYSVLTKSPPPVRHTPEQALLSIEENVLKHFKIASLSGADYTALTREAALAGIQGGTIYDAVLLRCAVKAEAEAIYTLNLKHFQNIAPSGIGSKLLAP
jgi:predicted nucleic acid-binding protein